MPNIGPIELIFVFLLLALVAFIAVPALQRRGARPEPAPRAWHPEEEYPEPDPMQCPRCAAGLEYVGTKRFHEGSRAWGFALGDLGELFVNRESFDVYLCGRCGRVELFVDGIGEEFRPH